MRENRFIMLQNKQKEIYRSGNFHHKLIKSITSHLSTTYGINRGKTLYFNISLNL